MKNLLKFLFIITLIGMIYSCKEDPVITPPVPDPPDTPYGTPYANVPSIDDIVMYEVNLRAFSETGDLQGVIDRLDEIKDLGVNVIWIMPIYSVGELKSINSPYCVKNFKEVGEEYGSFGDLRKLTDAAHAKNMAVIMDWVANHSSWDNTWISNKDWYTQDGSGNIISPPEQNWSDVADLNYDNMEMQNAMIAAMKYWVWETNIDGFRCDYADGVPYTFWQRALDTIKAIPNKKYILLAEGSRYNHFTAGFELIYGWDFYYKLKAVFGGENASALFTTHEREFSTIPAGKQRLRYSTNHDESAWDATPMEIYNGKEGALAASAATIFMGGAPLIYTGQEVGTQNNVPFFSNSSINWDGNPDMLQAYTDMMEIYSSNEVARKGANVNYSTADIICFEKDYEGSKLLILINVRDSAKEFAVPAELENSSWTNKITNAAVTLGDKVLLNNYEYLIFGN